MTEAVINKNKKSIKSLNQKGFLPERDIPLYLLLAPALIMIIIFCYIPIYGIIIGFLDYSPYKGIMGSEWVGLKHFKAFLTDYNFWRVMKNTIIINIYSLIFAFPIPIIFALLLNEVASIKFKKIVQTISYLPYFISWVVVASIIISILSPTTGVVNIVLNNLFGIKPINFMVKNEYFRSIIVLSGIWKSLGMAAVYYLAALSSIEPNLYEAAIIDGAGKWRQTWHITLPGLKSIIVVLLILEIGGLMNIGFERIFLLYNPLVYDVGDVISTYTYRLGIEQTQFSLTTSIGFTQSVVNFILVYTSNRLSRKLAGWSLW